MAVPRWLTWTVFSLLGIYYSDIKFLLSEQTSLVNIIATNCRNSTNKRFVKLSATTSGINDVKEAVKIAKNEAIMFKRETVLFIDEIHRFNKLQQVCTICGI